MSKVGLVLLDGSNCAMKLFENIGVLRRDEAKDFEKKKWL